MDSQHLNNTEAQQYDQNNNKENISHLNPLLENKEVKINLENIGNQNEDKISLPVAEVDPKKNRKAYPAFYESSQYKQEEYDRRSAKFLKKNFNLLQEVQDNLIGSLKMIRDGVTNEVNNN